MKGVSNKVRPAAVAGMFYPSNPSELELMVNAYLKDAAPKTPATPPILIAPHAGYIYSGAIAGSAYAQWLGRSGHIHRVLIIGPSHFVPIAGLGVSSAEFFETPFGTVQVDTEAVEHLVSLSLAEYADTAHARDHALEVHLPFLQKIIEHPFTIIPVLAGDAHPLQVRDLIAELWNDHTTAVISSDLTHFLDWATANRIDHETARAIELLQPETIEPAQACGHVPICGALEFARQHRMRACTLDLRNSGDTAGTRDRVVGYGAFCIENAVA